MVIDSVSIEASSSSSAEVEDSLDGFITVTDQNKPLRGQWFPRLRSLPLS